MIRSDLALAALATAAVPGMRPVSVAAVRSGEDNPLHQSALVEDVTGRKWVVRSPLGAAAGAELEQNDQLIRQLGKHLPFKVPAPAGYADLGTDGRAAVYPYVEGLALSFRHLPQGPGLASAVGRAIAAVHNMPHELFEEHAVPVFDSAQFRARKLAELDRAAETGHVPNGLLARWEHALDAAPMWDFTTTPTHGSLDGSSFLVVFSEDDAASGRVVGLTGWERAQVADPAEDFARLVERSHPRAVDAVFESYSMARSQRPDGYLLHRARLASEMRLLNGLAGAVARDDQEFVRARADELRKMDRLTANDDSLVPRTALVTAGPPFPAVTDDDSADASLTDTDVTGAVPGLETPSSATEGEEGGGTSPTPAGSEAQAAHTAEDGVEAEPTREGDEKETDDEPAFVVEPPSDGTHLEPAHPAAATESPRVSPSDVTAPIPMFRPVDAAGAERAAEGAAAEGQGAAVNEAVEQGAVGEEAGVREGPAQDDSEPEAQELEVQGREDPAEHALDQDDADQNESEQAATGIGKPVPGSAGGVPEVAEQGTQDAEAEADQHPVDPAVAPDGPADAVPPPEPEKAALEDAAHEVAEREVAEREADERLHTLYGMPESDELGDTQTR